MASLNKCRCEDTGHLPKHDCMRLNTCVLFRSTFVGNCWNISVIQQNIGNVRTHDDSLSIVQIVKSQFLFLGSIRHLPSVCAQNLTLVLRSLYVHRNLFLIHLYLESSTSCYMRIIDLKAVVWRGKCMSASLLIDHFDDKASNMFSTTNVHNAQVILQTLLAQQCKCIVNRYCCRVYCTSMSILALSQ